MFQFVLHVYGDMADKRLRSGAYPLERPLSSGKQSYGTRKEEWPLTEPLNKLEGKAQVTILSHYWKVCNSTVLLTLVPSRSKGYRWYSAFPLVHGSNSFHFLEKEANILLSCYKIENKTEGGTTWSSGYHVGPVIEGSLTFDCRIAKPGVSSNHVSGPLFVSFSNEFYSLLLSTGWPQELIPKWFYELQKLCHYQNKISLYRQIEMSV